MTVWYRPDHVTQRTDDPCALSNCADAAGRWLGLAATGGAMALEPGRVRQLAGGGSGRRNPNGCRSMTEDDIVTALRRSGLRVSIVNASRARALRLLSEVRPAAFAFAVSYDRWPEARDCMGTTAGPDTEHMIAWDPGTEKPVMNPLCHAYQSVPAAVAVDAALAYAAEQGRPGRIRMVRVMRPPVIAAGPTRALLERIAELERELDERDQALAEVARLSLEIANRADLSDSEVIG